MKKEKHYYLTPVKVGCLKLAYHQNQSALKVIKGGKFFEEKSGAGNYRYGFNGKEKDNEVKGEGNQYDYGMRIYDPRVVRFLSIDPLIKEYPELTPYQFASNRPIQGIDRDGEEFLDMIRGQLERRYKTAFQAQSNSQQLQQQVKQQTILAMQRRPIPQLNPAPVYSPEDQLKHDAIRIQKLSDAGYNADGTPKPLTKLAENKTWNNFSDNIALPIITAAAGEGLGKVAGSYLFSETAAKLPTRLVRVIDEEFAGSPQLGAANAPDVFVANPQEIAGLDSKGIAQKLTLKNSDGSFRKGPFRLVEFDTPEQGLAQPFNRTNPGYINGGKTAGGATEYVLPNLKITDLKNVTQKTVQ